MPKNTGHTRSSLTVSEHSADYNLWDRDTSKMHLDIEFFWRQGDIEKPVVLQSSKFLKENCCIFKKIGEFFHCGLVFSTEISEGQNGRFWKKIEYLYALLGTPPQREKNELVHLRGLENKICNTSLYITYSE